MVWGTLLGAGWFEGMGIPEGLSGIAQWAALGLAAIVVLSLLFSSMGIRAELRKQTRLMQEREQQLAAIRKSVDRNADELKDVSQGLMVLNKQFRDRG